MTAHRAAPTPPGGLLDELLTPPAVASLLGVSPPTVYVALRRRGGLTHIRTPGGQIRSRRRDVLAYCHRSGIAVPKGLVPVPETAIVHPERRVAARLARVLQEVSTTTLWADPVDALLHIGASPPAAIVLDESFGDDVIDRVCDALGPSGEPGYSCVLRLVSGKEIDWTGGAVPRPLAVGEASGRPLAKLVGDLLGTG